MRRGPSALQDLARLRSPEGLGLFASGGELYGDAVFGRDSIEAAEDVQSLRPDIVREVIVALVGLQGIADAAPGPHSNEEERGKIHHEHRSMQLGGRRISPRSQEMLQHLSALWGGDGTGFTYFGSADATPLFVRLVARQCELYGPSILGEEAVRRDGCPATVLDAVRDAVGWITRKMDESPLGFVEFQRRNPNGLPFQVWKDSGTSYLHRDGTVANYHAPIAAVEVQGYAYDALLGAAELIPDRAAEWRERARLLRDRVLERMWMPAEGYFAMGIDRDPAGRPRHIECLASNGALLLDTHLLEGWPGAEPYVTGVVRQICGRDFACEAGIRCRSLREDGLVDYQDYHGTWAVWLKETFDVARGLHRHGFTRLAEQVGGRLIDAVDIAGAHVEFLYVSPAGQPAYDYRDERGTGADGAGAQEIVGTNVPEAPQTWTVTAALALKSARGGRPLCGWPAPPLAPWAAALEAEVLAGMPPVGVVRTNAEADAAFARRARFTLNRDRAWTRDRASQRHGTVG